MTGRDGGDANPPPRYGRSVVRTMAAVVTVRLAFRLAIIALVGLILLVMGWLAG